MKFRTVLCVFAAVLLAANASCASHESVDAGRVMAQAGGSAAEGGEPASQPPAPLEVSPPENVEPPAPAPAPSQEAARPAVQAVEPEAGGDGPLEIPFARTGPSITESFERTVDMLTRERANNQMLKKEVADLKQQLAEKEVRIKDLQRQLQAAEEEVAKLEEGLEAWKADVLGFRDELRKAEEAEIDVLHQILQLLKKFEKQGESLP
jgi:hypothetical protein